MTARVSLRGGEDRRGLLQRKELKKATEKKPGEQTSGVKLSSPLAWEGRREVRH